MRNEIILNNKSSKEIKGLLIQELPPISKPMIRTTVEEIDGRDGDIITKLGYSAYNKQISIGLHGKFDINEVIKYFDSEGIVIFSNEPDKYYKYQIVDQIDFERLIRFRTANVTMHCQPFKYSTTEEPEEFEISQTTDEGSEIELRPSAVSKINFNAAKGDTSQTTYSGKNLFNKDNANSLSAYITLNNTLQTDNSLMGIWIECQANTTYTVQKPNSGTNNRFCVYTTADTPANGVSVLNYVGTKSGVDNNSSYTITTPATANYLGVFFGVSSTTPTMAEIIDSIQIEVGSTATSYEPYVGGTASPNPDYQQEVQTVTGRQAVSVRNKNLCNGITQNLYLVANTNTAGKISGNSGLSIAVEQNTDYTISVQSSQARYRVGFVDTIPQNNYDTVTAYNGANGDGTSNTLTVNSGSHKYLIVNVSDLTACMVEKGSSATDFVPYESQRYEIYLGTGNLLDPNTVVTGTIQADGSINTGATTYATTDYIEIDPTRVITKTATGSPRVKLYDASKNLISTAQDNDITDFNNAGDFQVPYSNAKYIRFTIYATDYPVANVEVKQPTIELCKIGNYQDYIYKQDGDWYLHKVIQKIDTFPSGYFDGIVLQGGGYYRVWKNNIGGATNNEEVMMISSHFRGVSYNRKDADPYNTVYSRAVNMGLTTNVGTTIASIAQWLTNNNVVLYYVLATPTDTQITDENLISQLEALANANSYDESTHVKSNSENKPMILNMSVISSNSCEVTNEGNIYSKPLLTIYGFGTINLSLNNEQMFVIDLGEEDNYVTIDTNAMEAYKDTLDNLMNRSVDGDYNNFKLSIGTNTISWSGNLTKIVIDKYSRWI